MTQKKKKTMHAIYLAAALVIKVALQKQKHSSGNSKYLCFILGTEQLGLFESLGGVAAAAAAALVSSFFH